MRYKFKSFSDNIIFFDTEDKKNFFKQIGIDTSKYNLHNALDDAKILREVYLKMEKK